MATNTELLGDVLGDAAANGNTAEASGEKPTKPVSAADELAAKTENLKVDEAEKA